MNIGEMLEIATSGYLRATEHRVNLAHAAEPISVPYFFNPRLDAGCRCWRCPTILRPTPAV